MLLVLVREIEGDRREVAVFANEAHAREAWEVARYVADNGPDDGPGDDPTIVTNCWLYRTPTADPLAARQMVRDGVAELLAAYAD